MLDRTSPASAPSDAQLLERAVADPGSFRAFVERHTEAIFRYVAARVGPVHAEDIVAETFAIAFDRRARFDRDRAESARPWLYGIAANRLHKHREAEERWLRRAAAEPISTAEPESSLADARIDAQRLGPRLSRALLALSTIERDVLLLFALEELTHEQIAKVLGIRRGTARTRLSRGCARLRVELEADISDDGEGGPA